LGTINNLHCCFVTGPDSFWRNVKIRAKYTLMRLQGLVYPDIFCIPWWLGAGCDFVGTGGKIELDKHDFVFAELNAGIDQLEYLKDLIKRAPHKMVILPGPPEIFESYAGKRARGLAIWVLRKAGQVWAYSTEIANFADDYAQAPVAQVIPWPFNYSETKRLGQNSNRGDTDEIRILIGVPLRFVGIAENAPHFIEECLSQVLATLPPYGRNRFKFFGMVYTKEDEIAWRETGFGRQLGVVLEPKKSYVKFLRFVGSCAAVISLPRFRILGRITFIAAALDKPGIFTGNVQLNRQLYLRSLISNPTDERLRDLLRELFLGLLELGPLKGFLPDSKKVQEVGDYVGNGAKVREILCSKL
jgi:hypothetical protein